MENMMLAIVGLGALYYVVKRLFKQDSGQCNCSGCGKAGSCKAKR